MTRALGTLAVAVALAAVASPAATAVPARHGVSVGGVVTSDGDALLAGIPQDGVLLGDPRARVRLVLWEDLGCPHCLDLMRRGFPTLVKRYVRTGRIALEFRGVGIIRPGSRPALLYVLAAGRQDRLWDLAARFYAQQDALELVATEVGVRRLARGIPRLDVARLLRDARSPAIARQADATLAQARRLGIPGTPSFGVRVDGGKVRPAVPTGLGGAAMTQLSEAALDLVGPKA